MNQVIVACPPLIRMTVMKIQKPRRNKTKTALLSAACALFCMTGSSQLLAQQPSAERDVAATEASKKQGYVFYLVDRKLKSKPGKYTVVISDKIGVFHYRKTFTGDMIWLEPYHMPARGPWSVKVYDGDRVVAQAKVSRPDEYYLFVQKNN